MSVFLPKTSFNLYADAKAVEKELLKFWEEIELEKQRKTARAGASKFILHDGPPYANGPIHIGHAENKFWKDALNKIFWQAGYDTPYIPGWDAHGLPIENAVEKQFKDKGIDKNSLSRQEFWDNCYEFAKHWMHYQMQQFKQLGVFADYENSYATFFENESIGIIECAHKFVEAGLLERRLRPVLWSYAEKTALAYAEIEYKDKTSNSIYVLFPIIETDCQQLVDAQLVVWTTTPWTLPANETIAYNAGFEYAIFEHNGKKYCMLENLFPNIEDKFAGAKITHKISGDKFSNTYVGHVLKEFNTTYKKRKLLHADFVEDQKGSGFVHIAPAHGEDDFALCKQHSLPIEDLLDGNGCFKTNIPLVAGISVKEAENIVLAALEEQNACIKIEKIVHSYPHSWRSKAPLIFRLTHQWFLKMGPIKEKALKALDTTETWVPKEGRNRLLSMLEAREDWCVSRQRIWGVPIGIFFNESNGAILNDPAFLAKSREKLAQIGIKNWWNLQVDDIDIQYSPSEWKRLDDIIEIWFESGATQYFVLQKMGMFPADIYLEGSDQHRGWFQSSLLISAFLTSRAPWKHIVTHGFCLDGLKQKMSKSLGNVINPSEWSADQLRLFFSTANMCHDVSMNENSIKNSQEMLFRFRNTMKFILGMLAIEEEPLEELTEQNYAALPVLEKWLLHRLYEIDCEYEDMLKTFQLGSFANALYEFCSQDLSAFYFDVRKDTLYCDEASNKKRKSAIMCMQVLAPTLMKWLAGITPFFAEEAWQCYLKECKHNQKQELSVHLCQRPEIAIFFKNEEAAKILEELRNTRRQITQKIEELREKKILNTACEAAITIDHIPHDMINELKEIAIVSSITKREAKGDKLVVTKCNGTKCPRCRFVYNTLAGEFCKRCANAVEVEKSKK